MASPLMRRLDAAIAAAHSQIDAACLRAERAIALARQGDVAQAHEEIAAIHSGFRSRPNPAVSAWCSLAQGLAQYFDRYAAASAARPSVQRAHALAQAAQLKSLQALCAAWMAHMDYGSGHAESMSHNIAAALRGAEPSHHAARSRACMVAAIGYHSVNRHDLAQPWYAKARQHATALGDAATLEALIYNQTSWRVQHAWRALLLPGVAATAGADGDLGPMMASVRSFKHFGQHAGATALAEQGALLEAQAHVLLEEYAQALALYEQHLSPALEKGNEHRECAFRAEMAWCLLQTGRGDDGRAAARAAQAALLGTADLDDCALAHARLAQVFDALGLPEDAARHRDEAAVQSRAHQVLCDEQLQALESALAGLPA
jgi:tetratricopeptide (TPR) repeat protein